MLKQVVEFALTQRLVVMVVALIAAAFGLYAYSVLPIDAFPEISPTQVKIILKAPGMTPEEVESRVIVPLEMEMLGLPKETMLRASAKYAIADITVDFVDGTDVFWARNQVAERLSSVRDALPATLTGGLAPISTPLSDVFMFTVEGGDLTLEEKRSLLDWTIRPALRTVPGVADVNTLGGLVKTFEVIPDNAALTAASLTIADLKSAIGKNNNNDGAGRVSQGDEALVVRATGAMQGVDDLANTVIRVEMGRIIRIGDVAKVQVGSITRYGAISLRGAEEGVEGIVIAMRGSDANTMVKAVRARLSEIETGLPAGVHINTFYDRSDLIGKAVFTVEESLIEASVLVLILLVVFLGNLRAAMVVAITLPFAALLTFLMMHLYGLSANLMSLGGLSIAIGMLVDGAVVVVENAVEKIGKHTADSLVPKQHRIYTAAVEVAVPVASGIVIICIVFLPLLALQGLEGKMFAPVALTIVFALSSSLLLSLTLVPVLCSWVLKPGHHHEAWLMRKLLPAYRRILSWALANTKTVYTASAAALVLAGVGYVSVGKTFMPTMDEGSILLQVVKHPSINLDHSVEGDLAIQNALLKRIPEITDIIARVGSDEIGLDPMGLNETDTFLVLAPKDRWRVPDKAWLTEEIRKVMVDFPGIEFAFTQPIEMRVSEMLTGSRGDLAVKIFGPDQNKLGELAGRIAKILTDTRGSKEVYTMAKDKMQYMSLHIDRIAAGRAGLDIEQIEDELRARIEGTPAGIIAEPNRRTTIVVRGDEDLRNDPGLFERLEIPTPDGGRVHVSTLAKFDRPEGAIRVARENASRFAVVQAYVSGRDLVGFVEEAQAAVARSVTLPSGYRIEWGGQFENQRRAAARLAMVVPVALSLIFFILFATLRSVRQSALIISNIPFAVVGGVLALWASGEYLSVPASVGFIALLGIAVLNGLVLVSHFNQRHQAGQDIETVVLEGAQRRLRPVLMTASITAFGLIPLLFASGPGSEIQKPLAIVVVGGLLTSTVLTLILLPILYRAFGVERIGTPRTGEADD
jgi:cobalt-zinc-cadmium resistance protein CzcA